MKQHSMRALRSQALKAAILNFMEFADQAIPDDDCCMCGSREDAHDFGSGHSFTPATQYHVMQLRKEVEKYLDVLDVEGATTVTHSDLSGNTEEVAVIPNSALAEAYEPPAGEHVLWKDGDFGIPEAILDRNGQVALNCCKVCGGAESELRDMPTCPGYRKKVFRHG